MLKSFRRSGRSCGYGPASFVVGKNAQDRICFLLTGAAGDGAFQGVDGISKFFTDGRLQPSGVMCDLILGGSQITDGAFSDAETALAAFEEDSEESCQSLFDLKGLLTARGHLRNPLQRYGCRFEDFVMTADRVYAAAASYICCPDCCPHKACACSAVATGLSDQCLVR